MKLASSLLASLGSQCSPIHRTPSPHPRPIVVDPDRERYPENDRHSSKQRVSGSVTQLFEHLGREERESEAQERTKDGERRQCRCGVFERVNDVELSREAEVER